VNSSGPLMRISSEELEKLEEGFREVERKLAVDRLSVEIVTAFAGCGIETLLLKGPVLGEWLYPGEVRPYCDSDLMVAPGDRARAIRVLERLGFREYRPWMPSPLSLDAGGTAYERGGDKVDLHCVLPGLDGKPSVIRSSLLAHSEHYVLDGAQLRVPDRDVLLLHVCLHAAHHANYMECKPFEDLRRAIAGATDEQWNRSLELARAYGGVAAFAAGLQVVPEGRPLARRLGIEDVRSHRFGLRREDNVIAEEIRALFSTQASLRQKLATVISELFPRSQYMRWWSPLARRGRLGLVAAYAWRPLWAVGQLPSAAAALWRSRRGSWR
jgi:Uncharacterised nucleotidyltransferase